MSAIFEHAAWQWAEMVLLSKRGRAAGIDSWSLLTGPWSRVLAYGSEELIEHFEQVGRPSLARFEREWLASRAVAA